MSDKKNKLGLFMLIALVIGNMVGSGVFMLPASIAQIGSIGLLSWIFTATGALCLAMVFAKMCLLVPKNGGPYAFARAGFGKYIGFQTAFFYWASAWIGNAAIAVAMTGYLRVFFPSLAHRSVETITIVATIWFLTLINIRGVRSAGFIQIITTILKFIPLLVVGLIGWHYFHPEYITHSFNVSGKSNFSAFSSAATLTLWAFIGVESATVPAGSVYNPSRNIPLATVIGTVIAAVIYIVCAVTVAGMIPNTILANSTSPFADAAQVIFGSWGGALIAAGAAIACFGTLNGWTLICGQIPMAIADDNLFPKIFSHRSKSGAPIVGLIVSAILIAVLVISVTSLNFIDQFNFLITITATSALIAYFYSALAEIIILPKEKRFLRKNCVNMVIAILAAAYSFWAIFGSSKEVIFCVMVLIFITIPLYAIMHRKLHDMPEDSL